MKSLYSWNSVTSSVKSVILLFITFSSSAQDIFLLRDPGNSSLILADGWTYHMGDEPDASQINYEGQTEMREEIEKENYTGVKILSKDIEDNQEKIGLHGKRADAIVKAMLQHSRSSSGVQESTNINTLVEEYLRLAYHGLRAKDKSSNVTLKTDFDEAIGTINVVPQDIGRVILNLISNAFYAVGEKRKQNSHGYEPTVAATTKKSGDAVLISIKDNGNGIPQRVLDKIFQPFFTTKPAGQATGLGLSLAYDIVTKGHNGELTVTSQESIGSTFTITLHV